MSRNKTTRLSTEERRSQLLAFGRSHFAANAYDALPMASIAKGAGVSKGLIFHYFGGRRGFYLATIEGVAEEVKAIITLPEGSEGDMAAFGEILRRFVAYVGANDGIYLALIRGGLGRDEDVQAILGSVREVASQNLLRAMGNPTLTPGAPLLIDGAIAFVEHTCAAWVENKAISEDDLTALLMGAIIPLIGAISGASAPMYSL